MNKLLNWLNYNRRLLFCRLIYPGFRISFSGLADCFLFSLFLMPSYFGVRLAFFDLTAVRFFELLLLCCIWKNRERRQTFTNLIRTCDHTPWIFAYFTVVVYTNLIHPSIGTIFYWLMNGVFVFYISAYLLTEEYGEKIFCKKFRLYVGILTLLSPLEVVIGQSPFQVLNTLGKGIADNTRFGSLRIHGPCTTSNGFSMVLCMLLPIVCYDEKRNRVDILKHWFLAVLVIINIFLTGARLAVGIMILELGACYIVQRKGSLARVTTILLVAIPVLIVFLVAFRNVSFVRSILCTLFSAVDEILDTNFAASFGADATILSNSSEYRKVLFQETILGTWLNPLLGRGGNYRFHMFAGGFNMVSVDNYYVGQYITYAWPGLITWFVMSMSFLWKAVVHWIRTRNQLMWLLIVSIVCYFISLWYLDQLQTFPIMLAVFALEYDIESRDSAVRTLIR